MGPNGLQSPWTVRLAGCALSVPNPQQGQPCTLTKRVQGIEQLPVAVTLPLSCSSVVWVSSTVSHRNCFLCPGISPSVTALDPALSWGRWEEKGHSGKGMPSWVVLGYSSKNPDGVESVWNLTGELSMCRKILLIG